MRAGDVLERRFRLEEIAGSGAMGVVFRAQDLARGEVVAVKVLRRPDGRSAGDEVARFDREAELLLALQHPGVVRYIAHGTTPEREPFLVMEWLAGSTLKDRIERGPLGPEETVDVGLALASALAGAHGRGVVHRDVKPANVFLVGGSTARVKLLDFGVARVRTGRALTEVGATIGTPAYMSPEQARGDVDVDARSDVFSLGAVLFHLVTQRLPFPAHDLLSVLIRVATERAVPVASLAPAAPPQLASLVDAMLSPAPAARPTTAQAFAALAAIRADLAPRSGPSNVMPVAARATMVQPARVATRVEPERSAPRAYPRRRRAVLGAIAAAVVLGAVGIGIAFALDAPSEAQLARRKQRKAERAMSSSPTAATAGARSADPAPRTQTELADATPCTSFWKRCEPAPFQELESIDPADFVTRCFAVARSVDPSAQLVNVTATRLVGARIDSTVGSVLCRVRTSDGGGLVVQIYGHRFIATSSTSPVDEPALPDRFCPVAAAARAGGVSGPTMWVYLANPLRFATGDARPVQMLIADDGTRATLDAQTCLPLAPP